MTIRITTNNSVDSMKRNIISIVTITISTNIRSIHITYILNMFRTLVFLRFLLMIIVRTTLANAQ